jgi:hypothetical protein
LLAIRVTTVSSGEAKDAIASKLAPTGVVVSSTSPSGNYGAGAGSGSLVTRNSPHNPAVLPKEALSRYR